MINTCIANRFLWLLCSKRMHKRDTKTMQTRWYKLCKGTLILESNYDDQSRGKRGGGFEWLVSMIICLLCILCTRLKRGFVEVGTGRKKILHTCAWNVSNDAEHPRRWGKHVNDRVLPLPYGSAVDLLSGLKKKLGAVCDEVGTQEYKTARDLKKKSGCQHGLTGVGGTLLPVGVDSESLHIHYWRARVQKRLACKGTAGWLGQLATVSTSRWIGAMLHAAWTSVPTVRFSLESFFCIVCMIPQ